ncbi:MAG: hypothetical protein LBS59_00990 [Puniceicoccales bacterium]|jgi:hypothetical protein|nr:hypothetical protein [Puniceicoccales bacterium]
MAYPSLDIALLGGFPGFSPAWRANGQNGTGGEGIRAVPALKAQSNRMGDVYAIESVVPAADPDDAPVTHLGTLVTGLIPGVRYRVYFVNRPNPPEGSSQTPEPYVDTEEFRAQKTWHLIDATGDASPYNANGTVAPEHPDGTPKYTATGPATRSVAISFGNVEYASYYGTPGHYTRPAEWDQLPNN